MRGRAPYVDHGWRHLPGGSDPLVIDAGSVDLAQLYYGAFWDGATAAIDADDNSLAIQGHIDSDDWAPPFGVAGKYSGMALLQGGIGGSQGQLIIGNASGYVRDPDQMAAITQLCISPTWSTDPVGFGPYLPLQTQVGSGTIRQWSADPVDPPHWEFGCFVDYGSGGQAMLTLRMLSDGSLVTATNPVVWDEFDEINAFWSTFTWGWD